MFGGVYRGRRVLVTGHTGFKGSWLCAWLLELGARVAGYALEPPTFPANFDILQLSQRLDHYPGDIRDRGGLNRVMRNFEPEIVFHLAAQSLVRESYREPTLTFETNTVGTLNVLEGLRETPGVRAAVIITSDKCYYNQEWTWGYRENDRLGGGDPYSASKACAELVFQAYQHSLYSRANSPAVATARAGNVIGGGDWAPDRIVPDCMRAWSQEEPLKVRQPRATRPWQHVLEPLSGYLWLGTKLWQGDPQARGQAFNFGPRADINQSVAQLITALESYWPGARWEVTGPASGMSPESTLLKLCCDKALNQLQWRAVLSFPDTIQYTAQWYREYYVTGIDGMFDFTRGQILDYTQTAAHHGLAWTKV